jgi:GDPmannose 4,6-dehydratase
MNNKRACIVGISGQDAYFLSKILYSKGYQVFGLHREHSKISPELRSFVTLIDGDLTDQSSLQRAFEISKPDEVYNLAGFSHIGKSFHQPELVIDVNTLGVVRLLDIIKNYYPRTKFLQASSYEVFAGNTSMPINEDSPVKPVSPYSIAKAAADEYVKLYRKNYGVWACSAYLGNHESFMRPEHFVTRKISKYFANLRFNKNIPSLKLGYLDAVRDFGFAGDYCDAMYRMVQLDNPEDMIISSNKPRSIRKICEMAALHIGINGRWFGVLEKESLVRDRPFNPYEIPIENIEDCMPIIEISPDLYRPADVPVLHSNSTKALKLLGWQAKKGIKEIIGEMIDHDSKNWSNSNEAA